MTDISVQIVDSSKELAGVPFSKSSENESDPLAIHDGVKTDCDNVKEAKEEEEVSFEGDAKEDCTLEKENGNKIVVLSEKLEDLNEEILVTVVTEEDTEAADEVENSDVLDANAPTPDLPDRSPEPIPNVEIEATNTKITEIEIEKTNPKPDEIESKLKEFDIETPMQIDTDASFELPKSENIKISENDLVDKLMPAHENITEVENSEPEKEIDNDVDMVHKQSSDSVDDIVNNQCKDTLLETDSTLEKSCTDKTDVASEKILSVSSKTEAVIEKTETFLKKTETVLERTQIEPDKTDSVSGKTEKIEENSVSVPDNTQIIPQKIETETLLVTEIVPEKTATGSFKIKEIVPEKTEAEHLKIIEIISSKTKSDLEKSVTVRDKTKSVVKDIETVSTKAVTIPKTKVDLIQNLKTEEEKRTDIEMKKEFLTDKLELPRNLQVTREKSEKMEVDSEKMDTVSDKIRVKKFHAAETNSSKNAQPINGDISKEDQPVKRRASDDIEESPLKRLCQEVEKNFPHHDAMINEYIKCTTKNNIDEIQKHTEHLLSEIQTLRELAQKKEQEWNNILHLKKIKEEILLRLLRRKQVLSFEKSLEINGSTTERSDPFDYLNQSKNLAIDKSDEISGLSIKQPGSSSVLRQSVSPINPIQSLQNAMAPVMPVAGHFNPLSGLPPPYDKATAAHMQSMSNNLQNMTNSMQNMSNNMQNMSNSMPNMPNSMPNMPNSMPNMPNSMPNMPNMSNSMQNLQNMAKPMYQPMMMPGPMPGFPRDMNPMNGQIPTNFGMPMGRQGPTKDVKSIIADYRQRNPDVTPRRGRRMKSILNPNMMNAPRNIAPKDLNNLNNLNMLFNNLDMNQKAMLERLQQLQAGGLPNSIFKDALVQFANMQQANAGLIHNTRPESVPPRPEHHPKERRRVERQQEEPPKPIERPPSGPRLPPPPYPEISLLPVSSSQPQESQPPSHPQSLLHGILTKPVAAGGGGASTLAQLLTAPDRERAALPLYGQAKNCGEITITPVQPSAEPQPDKPEEVVQLQDDEESPAPSEPDAVDSPAGGGGSGGSGRLVIDEAAGEEPPLCQGCRRRDAQFVCAGCANQWYCSRDCQVAAWDDHSEMCSG